MSSVWEYGTEELQEILKDMGFEPYSSLPCWVEDLAQRLLDAGYKKKKSKRDR